MTSIPLEPSAPLTPVGAWHTMVRGIRLTPEFRNGLGTTLVLAAVATAGRIIIPVAVQQTIDHGFRIGHPVDVGYVQWAVGLSIVGLLLTSIAAYLVNYRLYRTTETGLAAMRVRAFRHVHDLSMLHQAAERRGTLVAR